VGESLVKEGGEDKEEEKKATQLTIPQHVTKEAPLGLIVCPCSVNTMHEKK
jgi:hypothetical protein